MASQKESIDINCEFCKKTFDKASILRHIGKSTACKSYYGKRFTEMKKEQARNRVYKQREKMSKKEKKKALKKIRQSYAKNEVKKEENRRIYQDKKEQIKAKNEKESKDLLLLRKNENEKEIGELSDKGKNLNILYKSTTNLKEILKQSSVICQNCKDCYDPSAILKHIGNNKECRSFYGSNFETLKKEKNRLRIKDYKLAKQREKYAFDPKIRENKKEANKKTYKNFKDKQSVLKEKERVENIKKDAKNTFEFKKKVAKESNKLWRKKLQWIVDCFNHFLETFHQTNEQVRSEMADMTNSIRGKFEKMENEIDAIVKKVENSEDYFEICSAFKGNKKDNDIYEGGKEEEDIKHVWQTFEQFEIGKRLENILENVNESEKKEEWFYVVQIIQDRFKEKFKGWWEKQEYTARRTCIICSEEPNCLEKNWLTRAEFEKVKFSVMVYVARGLKDPSDS